MDLTKPKHKKDLGFKSTLYIQGYNLVQTVKKHAQTIINIEQLFSNHGELCSTLINHV